MYTDIKMYNDYKMYTDIKMMMEKACFNIDLMIIDKE